MGNNEGEKPSKSERQSSPAPAQEQSNVHVYHDWAAVQAYYGPGAIPPPYFNPAVASGHPPHPYMWAPPQMMPPYGSPYAAMYPHGGIYGPSATPVVATPLSLETPARSSGNEGGSTKKIKEANGAAPLGNGNAESAGEGGNHAQSHSTDCGTEGSCDRSDDSTAREDRNGVTESGKFGMQTSACPGGEANRGNCVTPGIAMTTAVAVGNPLESNDSGAKANAPGSLRPSGIGMQDERERKREKRKQSNRESARRSRLRKQAEMEELSKEVDSLTVENMALRSEINKLIEDSEKLRTENAALMEKLKNTPEQPGKVATNNTDDKGKLHNDTQNVISNLNESMSNNENVRGDAKK